MASEQKLKDRINTLETQVYDYQELILRCEISLKNSLGAYGALETIGAQPLLPGLNGVKENCINVLKSIELSRIYKQSSS